LPLFFIQVVIFCKANWTFFNDTCVIPTHTLSFEVTYYHVLFMACPKHAFAYGNVNCNGSQLTTCKRINAKTFKLLPSWFHLCYYFFYEFILCQKRFHYLTNVALAVLNASNKPTLAWWGHQYHQWSSLQSRMYHTKF
jgi:hypothetical protein